MKNDIILNIFKEQKQAAKSQRLFSIEKRISLLRLLKETILKYEEEIYLALSKDLGRSKTESYLMEVQVVCGEIDHCIKHLKCWMKPTKVCTPLVLWPAYSRIIHEPKGVVLIIAPWNYPLQLSLSPAVAAISAGNTVVLKPSELSPHVAKILEEIVVSAFDSREIVVVSGTIDETIFLLDQPFDHIFYTGNGNVAKSILKQAAKHLTPVTLELGGKSPALVFSENKLELSAKRIVWGKFINAGQTCVAPDYVLISSKMRNQFVQYCEKHLQSFYGNDIKNSPDYARIVNNRHFHRLVSLFTENEVLIGGKSVESDLFIEPTLIKATGESKAMKDEIFGPILPIIEIESLDEAIRFINDRDKPLALYLFSDDPTEKKQLINQVSAGGVCINDTIMHLVSPHLPFGGVGASGYGAYHGKFGFDLFSHHKTVLKRFFIFDLFFKYPPYLGKLKFFRFIFKFL